MRHIAIIGSGPAGCYLADQLLRLLPDASIDILERLPVPFGLVRYGVAPDHQSTKAVARVLDRVLARERVSFFGNVEVGRDVQLEETLSMYDAVALATGAGRDRRLGIPGEGLPGVAGSGAFTRWYNGHPEAPAPPLCHVHSAVIIGNGNVALDVARILAKGRNELAGSDLPADVMAQLANQPIAEIHIVGRRGAADAKFTPHELEELGTLQRARPVIAQREQLEGHSEVVNLLRRFAEGAAAARLQTPEGNPSSSPGQAAGRRQPEAGVKIHFHFHLKPAAFVGEGCLAAVQFEDGQGAVVELPAQLAVTCIGFEACACCRAEPRNGVFANENGKVGERLYVTGWAKRGPSGTIPTNRTEAQQVAQRIAQEICPEPGRVGGAALRQLLAKRRVDYVDHAGWRRIEAAELAGLCPERCRTKFTTLPELLEAARLKELRMA